MPHFRPVILTMKQSVLTALISFAVSCAAFGQVLTPPVNKLIRQECARQGIVITADEINAEVHRIAGKVGMTVEQWLQKLQQERNISPEQYRNDFVRWTLALERLAGSRLTVSEAELMEAYHTMFGSAVLARQITLATRTEAEAVLAEVKQHPEAFVAIAKNKSINTATQSFGGITYPIRRHTINPDVEKMLFAMEPGDISPVVEYPPGHFTIFRCESRLPQIDVNFDAVKEQLLFQILDTKRQQVAGEIIAELRTRGTSQVITAPKVRCLETWRQNRLARNRPFRPVRTDATAYTVPPTPTAAIQAIPPEAVSIERVAESTQEIKLSPPVVNLSPIPTD